MKTIIKMLCFMLFLLRVGYGKDINREGVNRIVAVVNDEIITQVELEHKKVFLIHQIKQAYGESQDISEVEQTDIEKAIVEKLIINKLIMQEAKRQSIGVTEAEIKERIDNVYRRFPNEESFRKNLQQAGLTIENLRESYEYEIIMRKIFYDKARSEIVINPGETEEFYRRHSLEFQEPERIRLRNIFIKKEGRFLEEISQKLEGILTLLKEGMDFKEVAKKYSEGANASRGGEMGEIRRGELSSNVEEVIFNLNEDEISDWIETESGFYLFKAEERLPTRILNFNETEDRIRTIIFNQKMDERFNNWITKLKEKAYIKIINRDER